MTKSAKDRNREEMVRQIRCSAQDIEIPEALYPEKIKILLSEQEHLRRAKQEESSAESETKENIVNSAKTGRRKGRILFYGSYAAAAVVLLCVCGTFLLGGNVRPGWIAEKDFEEAPYGEWMAPKQEKKYEEAIEDVAEEAAEVVTEEENVTMEAAPGIGTDHVKEPKKDAGEIYRVAKDYAQVYDVIVSSRDKEYYYVLNDDIAIPESVEELQDFAEMDGVRVESAVSEKAAAEEPVSEEMASKEQGEAQYSETNRQYQDVDEGDIVKTDGEYLYIGKENKIYIAEAASGALSESVVVDLPLSGNGNFVELYVDGEIMAAVVEERFSELEEVKTDQEKKETTEETSEPQKTQSVRTYETISRIQTTLYIYSLEEPLKPMLSGQVSQDGFYETSRKIEDYIYLFTDQWIGEECYYSDGNSKEWVPLAGGMPIEADHIYLPERGNSSLIVSSVNINQPGEIYDTVMVVHDGSGVHVSAEELYLYHTKYSADNGSGNRGTLITEIAKFALKEGQINAVSAADVEGRIPDTFAVNDQGGRLRVLTTVDQDRGSDLYLFDENLKLQGKLTGIAPGEEIYSARFLNDMVYFVTYRNIDPLFAVDLSDPKNPEILGELKITGYSEYLHMWGGKDLFGIGYETDPESGTRKGIKLSMFDVSDPLNLKETDKLILKDADSTPALYQYKTVLADERTGLVGFVVEDYDGKEEYTYVLFCWKDGKFEHVFSREIGFNTEQVRGMYVGDFFYIVTLEAVYAHDMKNDFKELSVWWLD